MPGPSGKMKIAVTAGIFFIFFLSILTGMGIYYSYPASETGEDLVVTVKNGMSLREISSHLSEKGLIRSKFAFMALARLKGHDRRIKSGEYLLNPSMPPARIMEVLTKGAVITHPVTIPEGFSIRQIAKVLSENGFAPEEEFISYALGDDIPLRYGIDAPGIEGYLYPDTYYFARGQSVSSIVDVMIKRFKQITAPLEGNIRPCGMTLNEVITLASIIEKETGRAEERPLIASVFLNRLKKKMRLESDPTVIYGIENFSGNLKKKDLSSSTPYNTYTIKGLPPGPIASPGEESIMAVLFPDKTDFLYFVSKNDGSHYFSKTLAEHNRAVYIYQKRRR